MEKSRNRLSLQERIVIETLIKENRSKTYIANQLGRNRSSISREINNWIKKPSDKYDANLAHWYAKEINNNKRCQDKINTYPRLKIFVYKSLLKGTTPELIAGQIKIKYPNDPVMSISHEAIYQHIYRHRQSNIAKKLIKLLPYHHHKRKNKRKFNKKRTTIKDQVSIDLRPKHIQQRQEVGHWEGDLMIGVGQKSAIATLVERKTRYTIVMKIKDRKSKTVTKEFASSLNNLNKIFRKSMTYDNGVEMANHKWLANQTGINIYFAHPYSSWERGTNENTNGLIRRFFPKGTDFNKISLKQLKDAQNNLNDRPRKVLGYKTPNEKMNEEIVVFEQDIGQINYNEIFAKTYSEKTTRFN